MTTSVAESVTEDQARKLLAEVKAFRTEWARFAVQSKDVFDAFREKGASLPDGFVANYKELLAKKATLAAKIAGSITGLDVKEWSPPEATDSLHEFEQKLDDLIRVAKDLASIIAEKRARFVSTLTAVCQLRTSNKSIEAQITRIRDESAQELNILSSRSSRLADIDLGGKVSVFQCLLALVDDAAARHGGVPGQATTLTPAECQASFELVSQKLGMALAIEALRSGFTTPDPSTSRRSVEQPIPLSDVVKSSAESQPGPNIDAAATGQAANPASRTAIQSLVETFSAKPHAIAPGSHRSVNAAALPFTSPNPVSLSDLADAGNRLKLKAHSLSVNVLDPTSLENNLTPEKIRAMGYSCLASLIEMAGYIFTERGKNAKFVSRLLHDFLYLFAESQNSVRVEGEKSGVVATEQTIAFKWLKHTCSEDGEQILIERFMRLEDRADPTKNPDLAKRVLRQYRQLAIIRKSEQTFSDLKRCCGELLQLSENADPGLTLPLWNRVNDLVKQLISAGIKTSETKLREVLLAIIDNLPEATISDDGVVQPDGVEISDEFRQVIDSIHEYLATQPDSAATPTFEEATPEVARARELLAGKTLVVIGGVCKPHAAQRLKRQLKLGSVRWLEATKQDRVSEFRAALNGASVVVLITRLIGHKHNDVRQMCSDAGIPWVQTRHSSGYSVNQIAAAILEQASEQLQAA